MNECRDRTYLAIVLIAGHLGEPGAGLVRADASGRPGNAVTRLGENAADGPAAGAMGFVLAGRRESCLVSAVSECRAVRRDGGFVRGLPDLGFWHGGGRAGSGCVAGG